MDAQTQNPLLAGAEPIASIDAARGILRGPPPEEKTETPAPAAEDAPRTPDPAPEAEVAAETPSDEVEVTETDEPETAIDPPSHWKAAEKEAFKKLSPDVQSIVLAHEQSRERGIKEAMRKAAEERKAAEAERTAALTQRQTYTQQLDTLLPALQQQTMGEFADIRTPVDYARMCAEDPARAKRYDGHMAILNAAFAERHRLAQMDQEQRASQQREYIAQAEQRLVEAFPEWSDQERGRKEIGEIRSYLAKEYGIPTERLASMAESYEFQIARKAMLYDRAQKAKAEAAVKPVPKVQVPGTAKTKADRVAEDRAAKLKRLEQTGSLDDARGLLRI